MQQSEYSTHSIVFTFEPALCNGRSLLIDTMLHIIFICASSAMALVFRRKNLLNFVPSGRMIVALSVRSFLQHRYLKLTSNPACSPVENILE